MAEENQDGQEKTEEPPQQRLQKAAEDGQLLTSKEMMVFTTLAAGLLLFMGLSPFFDIGLGAWSQLFVIDSAENLETLGLAKVRYGFWLVILATMIFGIPLMIITVLTQAAVGGLNFSNKAYNFKPNKINPISGLKRIFSVKGLVELGKAVLKVVLLFSIGALVILQQLPSITHLSLSSLGQGIGRVAELFPYLVGALLIALLIIGAIDYAWQRHTHKKSLMMTLKRSRTSPSRRMVRPIRAKIRRMQMQRSQNYASRALDKSDRQPLSSPTRRICRGAEIYRRSGWRTGSGGDGRGRSPADHRPCQGGACDDASHSDAGGRSISSEIGGEIAEGLYNAVAVILAYVFRIDSGESLDMPELTLPPELRFDENGNLEQGA